MTVHFIEAVSPMNWGKFLLVRPGQEEFDYKSLVTGRSLLRERHHVPGNTWVLDLETGEGACFRKDSSAHEVSYELSNHGILVCPLYEPFLEWLFTQDLTDLHRLPRIVELPNVSGAFKGYRRGNGKQ